MATKTEEQLVQEALRAGALPHPMARRNPYNKRYSHTDTVVHCPDESVLVLVANNRVTSLGREWDRQKVQESWSSEVRQNNGKVVVG